MPAIGVGLGLLAALAMASLSAAILRRLPPPVGEPDAPPYSRLASRRFFAIVCACCSAALVTSGLLAPWPTWPVWFAVGTVGVLLAVVDAHTGFLPLRLTWGFAAAVAVGVAGVAVLRGDATVIGVAALCGAGAFGLFWLLWGIGQGLGFGDVRLAALLGLATGAASLELAVWSLLMGGFAGVAWGLVTRWRRGADGPFPYGPALVLGPYLALGVTAVLALAGAG